MSQTTETPDERERRISAATRLHCIEVAKLAAVLNPRKQR